MKYSIIMPYYDRALQLQQTLLSFRKWYANREDYEVIIVEDTKQNPKMIRNLKKILIDFEKSIALKRIRSTATGCYNPATAYNLGVVKSDGKFLVLTSPECLHDVDILSGLDQSFENDEQIYVVCACKALDKKGNMHMWYQHSQERNAQYHFCSALSVENYDKIGGFNDKYSQGYGYDDDSFRDRVKHAGIEFESRDDLLTIHQWHQKIRPDAWKSLLQRNKLLYEAEFEDVN